MQEKREAFKKIYDEHHRLVYHIAFHYLQNVEEAEEITQDVFVQIYQSAAKFEGKSSLKTWIYRISINKSLDFIKFKNSKKRWFIFGHKSQNELELAAVASHEQPDTDLLHQEKTAILYAVINELPANQKTAFILSKIDGLTHPEISEIMQLTRSSIEALLFRAKKTLQIKLAQKFEEYQKKKNN
jgi:RNA polymerase sigma-70 factor (ECF subfamily)